MCFISVILFYTKKEQQEEKLPAHTTFATFFMVTLKNEKRDRKRKNNKG